MWSTTLHHKRRGVYRRPSAVYRLGRMVRGLVAGTVVESAFPMREQEARQ